MDLKLSGKRVLVTGSTSGIGEAIAKTFAQEGALVVVHGRRAAEAERVVQEIRAAGGQAAMALGDLGNDSDAAKAVEQALGAFGGIDILVNNAGAYPAKPWFQEDATEWNDVYNTNVASMIRVINHLVPKMKEAGWGRVISLASGVATKPQPGMGAYSATKAAALNLVVSLAQSLGDSGVTSNAVSPGLILTPGIDEMFDKSGVPNDVEVRAKLAADYAPNPLGRAGFPQEIADAVVFLASDRASYINGQNLRVDGGYVPTVN